MIVPLFINNPPFTLIGYHFNKKIKEMQFFAGIIWANLIIAPFLIMKSHLPPLKKKRTKSRFQQAQTPHISPLTFPFRHQGETLTEERLSCRV